MKKKNYKHYFVLLIWTIIITAVSIVSVKAAFGDLDTTFGFNGAAYSHLQLNKTKLARQSDGKFLETGHGGTEQIYIRRFNSNGNLDTSFGNNGYAIPYNSIGYINDIALQSDGKIVVCGTSGSAYYVWRFNANGTHDSSFGTNGRAFVYPKTNPFHDYFNDVAVFKPGSTSNVESIMVKMSGGLHRLNSNGTLNSSFGTNGTISTLGHRFLTHNASQFQNSSIYVAGNSFPMPQQISIYLHRYTSTGQFDSIFGGASLYSNNSAWHGSIMAFKRNNQGKFVVGATLDDGSPETTAYSTVIGLHSANGTLENSIITPAVSTHWVKGIGINSDNTILLGGSYFMRKFSADLTILQNAISIPVESFFVQPDGKFVVSTPGVIRRYLQ
jgi:uncharacterized delta-60 repeat protein